VLFEYAASYLLSGSYDVQTAGYRAPEALLRCSFSENIDVWSIGVVLVELLTSERVVPEGVEELSAVKRFWLSSFLKHPFRALTYLC
jgi:serine/threonine protein kinase